MLQDFRYAIRVLAKSRGVTLIAVIALALGIGANTAIFSVVHAVLLSPLPYRDPERLVSILGRESNPLSMADFGDIRDKAQSFESMGAAELWGAAITGRDAPEEVLGMHFSEDMFRVLGVAALRGRTFDATDFAEGRDHVLVIGYALWQRAFGGAPDIVGQKVLLDGDAYTLIGVMPPGFHFAPFWVTQAEMWSPMDVAARRHRRTEESLRVFGRLKAGVARSTAQAEVDQIGSALEAAYPESNSGLHFFVESLPEKAVRGVRPALEILLAAVGMVLLIACANVASLALVRATARQKEIAVRLSLGAQRMRIARQFLVESVVLSLTGGLLGLALASFGMQALQTMLRPDSGEYRAHLPQWDQLRLDPPVLLFTLALAVITGILFGLAPAFAASKGDVNDALKDGGRGSTSGGSAVRKSLVGVEIAVALVLLIGAGLLMRSFLRLRAVDAGFDPKNVVSMTVSVTGRPEYVGASRELLYRAVLERVQAVPGVRQASMVNHLPIAGDRWGIPYWIEGRPLPLPSQVTTATYRSARPNYFSTMRTAIVKGRDFNDRDTAEGPGVIVVNETLARREFPNQDPIGLRMSLSNPAKNPRWLTIVGVIHDVSQNWGEPVVPEVFVPFLQNVLLLTQTKPFAAYMTLVARTDLDAVTAMNSIKTAVWGIDRNLPLSHVQTLEHAIGNATWQSRFSLMLIGIFSGLALVLAMIGVYGVMSYEIAQRTHEIGIRLALGADRAGVARLIAGQSLPIALIGIACGLAAAAGLVRLMRSMLYQIDAVDPLTFAIVPFVILVVATVAAVVPARRAMRVDPMIALRHE